MFFYVLLFSVVYVSCLYCAYAYVWDLNQLYLIKKLISIPEQHPFHFVGYYEELVFALLLEVSSKIWVMTREYLCLILGGKDIYLLSSLYQSNKSYLS